VRHGETVYIAGQIADNLAGDIQAQAVDVLRKIDELLKKAGTERSKLLSVTVWLPHIGDFSAFNEIYDVWIPKDATPARACVESRLADPRIKVEVAAIAAA
jgi:enamine deaminase RidA (YjgF/YER057c/UK114 family)